MADALAAIRQALVARQEPRDDGGGQDDNAVLAPLFADGAPDVTQAQAVAMVEHLESTWRPPPNHAQCQQLFMRRFEVTAEQLQQNDAHAVQELLARQMAKRLVEIVKVAQVLRRNEWDVDDGKPSALQTVLAKVERQVRSAYQSVATMCTFVSLDADPSAAPHSMTLSTVMSILDLPQMKDSVRITVALMDRFFAHNLYLLAVVQDKGSDGGNPQTLHLVMKNRYGPDGTFLHCLEKVCSLRSWVHAQFDQDTNLGNWIAAADFSGLPAEIIKTMSRFPSSKVRVAQPRYMLVALQNGVWNMNTLGAGMFTPHRDVPPDVHAVQYIDAPWEPALVADLSPATVMRNIPTPTLDSVYDFQGYSERTRMVYNCFLGQLRHPGPEGGVAEPQAVERGLACYKAQWRNFINVIGPSGCGKSTLAGLVERAQPDDCTACISAHGKSNATWTAGKMATKPLTIVFEATKELDNTLPPALVRSMTAHEMVPIEEKYKAPETVKVWTGHLMIVGTEYGYQKDDDGSITRRTVPIFMKNVVPFNLMNESLWEDYSPTERFRTSLKFNVCYLICARAKGTVSHRELFSEQINEGLRQLQEATCPMYAFLKDKYEMTQNPADFVEVSEFKAGFIEQQLKNGVRGSFSLPILNGTIQREGLAVSIRQFLDGGRQVTKEVIVGIRPKAAAADGA